MDGSVEAILDILETYDEHDRVRLDLVHFGVGQVTPSDLEVNIIIIISQQSFTEVNCTLHTSGTPWAVSDNLSDGLNLSR